MPERLDGRDDEFDEREGLDAGGEGEQSPESSGGDAETDDHGAEAEPTYGRGFDVESHEHDLPDPEDTARLQSAVDEYGPHDLDRVLPLINPHVGESAAYDQNCGPVARAFADTYQQRETRVAPGLREEGEYRQVMTRWMDLQPRLESTYDEDRYLSHEEYTDVQWKRIAEQAEGLADGTVLTIGVQWNIDQQNAGGHWFNAVKVDGKLTWIDAQHNRQHDWPPGYKTDVESVFAAQREGAATQWKELDLRD